MALASQRLRTPRQQSLKGRDFVTELIENKQKIRDVNNALKKTISLHQLKETGKQEYTSKGQSSRKYESACGTVIAKRDPRCSSITFEQLEEEVSHLKSGLLNLNERSQKIQQSNDQRLSQLEIQVNGKEFAAPKINPVKSTKVRQKTGLSTNSLPSLEQVRKELEQEKSKRRQLDSINEQLRRQIRQNRINDTKFRRTIELEKVKSSKEIQILKVECDELKEKMAIVKKSVKNDQGIEMDDHFSFTALQQQNRKLQESLTLSQKSAHDTNVELIKITESKAFAEKKIEQYGNAIQNLKEEVMVLREEKEEQESTIRQLREDLEDAKVVNSSLECLKTENQQLGSECHRQKQKLDILEEGTRSKSDKIDDLQIALKDSHDQSYALKKKLEDLQSQMAKMKREAINHNNTMKQAEIEKRNLLDQLNSITEERDSWHSKYKMLVESRESITSDFQLKDEIEMQNLQMKIEQLSAQYNKAKEAITACQTDNARLERELTTTQSNLDDTEKELLAKESSLIGLDVRRSELEDEVERLNEINEELLQENNSYQDMSKDHQDLMRKHRERIDEITKYKEKIEYLQREDVENTKHLTSMIQEGKRLGDEIHLLREENLELENELCKWKKSSSVDNKNANMLQGTYEGLEEVDIFPKESEKKTEVEPSELLLTQGLDPIKCANKQLAEDDLKEEQFYPSTNAVKLEKMENLLKNFNTPWEVESYAKKPWKSDSGVFTDDNCRISALTSDDMIIEEIEDEVIENCTSTNSTQIRSEYVMYDGLDPIQEDILSSSSLDSSLLMCNDNAPQSHNNKKSLLGDLPPLQSSIVNAGPINAKKEVRTNKKKKGKSKEQKKAKVQRLKKKNKFNLEDFDDEDIEYTNEDITELLDSLF